MQWFVPGPLKSEGTKHFPGMLEQRDAKAARTNLGRWEQRTDTFLSGLFSTFQSVTICRQSILSWEQKSPFNKTYDITATNLLIVKADRISERKI